MTGLDSSDLRRTVSRRALAAALGLLLGGAATVAENIDPTDDQQQYAWSENGGWINFEPSGNGGPGVQVSDFELRGWAWAENLGWINMSCRNQRLCTVDFGVKNDGRGNLSGHAWAENAGWINFRPTTGGEDVGVRIDPSTGIFHGTAWAENAGWITFDFHDPELQYYQVATTWSCEPPPPAPSPGPSMSFSLNGGAFLYWGSVPGATGFDLVQGDLDALRAAGGDFGMAEAACVAENETANAIEIPDNPAIGEGIWLLARPTNCGGAGTFDSTSPPQVGSRDSALGGGNVCASP